MRRKLQSIVMLRPAIEMKTGRSGLSAAAAQRAEKILVAHTLEVGVRVFVPVFGRVLLEVSLVWIIGSDVPLRSDLLLLLVGIIGCVHGFICGKYLP